MASKANLDSQDVRLMRKRIKELEDEVARYKTRLDELRKAKNTTVMKREREVLEVGAPNLGKRRDSTNVKSDGRVSALEKQIEEMAKRHETELRQLREEHETKKPNFVCDHEEVIANLKSSLQNLEAHTSLLEAENSELKERVESLMMELSIKEAKWCETEEALNLKLKQQWGEKYAEWMAQTENKLAELQQANNLMRTLLKKQGRRDGVLPPDEDSYDNPGPSV